METEIKVELMALLDGIKRHDAPCVSRAAAFLDQVLEERRASLHPRLAHFLENRSYAKALAWLEGDATAGGPGGPRS